MIVAVVGSRHYPDLEAVEDYVRDLLPHVIVVSGGAIGVDRTAERMAIARKLKVVSYRPEKEGNRWIINRYTFVRGTLHEWKKIEGVSFGGFRDAAFYRNGLIMEAANLAYVFRAKGTSNGTDNAIEHAKRLVTPLVIVGPPEPDAPTEPNPGNHGSTDSAKTPKNAETTGDDE
jgi:hypothetical protein